MNATQRKFGLMAAMYMMAANGNSLYEPIPKPEPTPDWQRKKCKSCKLFSCSDNRHKWRSNPMAQACERYEHK